MTRRGRAGVTRSAPVGGEALQARRTRRGEAGSTSLEVVLLVPVLMLLALFVLWAGRGGRAALMTDLAAEEAATAAALTCEEDREAECEDLVTDVLSARPGLDFLCIGGPRPVPGETGILEEEWLVRDDLVPDPSSGVTAANTEVSGIGVLGVSFVCETDGAVAPLRGVFPTVEFRGQASEVAVLQGAPKAGVSGAVVVEGDLADPGDPPKLIFTLTLDAPATAEVVLPYTITGTGPNPATEVSDYTLPAPSTVTIQVGNTGATIEVEVVRDDLFEADETLELVLGEPPDPALLNLDQARRSAIGTIRDDDDPPTVTVSDAAPVTEGDGVQLTFQVGLAAAAGVEVTVDYETADGTATLLNTCRDTTDRDYVKAGDTLTFGPGETGPRDVTVTIDDDRCGEGPETVELRLQASGAQFSGTVGRGTPCPAEAEAGTDRDDCAVGTILDDEPGLSVGDARACENADPTECGSNPGDPAGSLVFTVTRVGPKTPEVTVRYFTRDDDNPTARRATAGADYTGEPGPCPAGSPEVVIPRDGTGRTTLTVQVDDDGLDEDDETFLVELCNPSDSAWIDTSPGRGTIIDDDDPPDVLVSDASVTEADSAVLSFDVALSAPSGRATGVTVEYCTEDGTAAEPDDYTGVACTPSPQGEVRFGPGETGPKQAGVTIIDDDLDEEDETVVLRLGASNAGFADPGGETGPCPAEVPNDPNTPADESDYADDRCAVGVIVNDDAPPLLRVGDARGTEGTPLRFEVSLVSATDGTSPVAAQRPVTAEWSVVHGTTVDGDLVVPPPPPATQLTGEVVFGVGHRTASFVVPTFDDSLDEDAEETFDVVLRLVPGDPADPEATVDADTAGTGTVADDDDPPAAEIVVCPDAALGLDPCPDGVGSSAVEGGTLRFTVRLGQESGRDVVVGWRTGQKSSADLPYGTATGADLATDTGADYVNVASGTVTIDEGSTSATLDVQSVDDGRAPHAPVGERDELFEVWLDTPSGPDPTYRRHPSDYRADGRIVDDDEHELRLLDTCTDDSFPDYEVCVGEDDGQAVFTVGLFIAGTATPLEASQAVTAPYWTAERPSEGEEAATAGADFTSAAPNSSLTIPAGSDSTTVSVAVSDDGLYEHDETFLLRLGAPDYGSLAGGGTAIAVIVDDDDEPQLTVSDAAAGEGEDLQFTLNLTPEAGRTVSVDYQTAAEGAATGGTACSGDSPPDFVSLPSTPASFGPGTDTVTVTVETCEDTLDEDDDEMLTLKLSGFDGIDASSGASSPCPAEVPDDPNTPADESANDDDDCAVGTITDDDPLPTLSLEAPAAAVAESATATFTARLDNPSGRVVRAQVAFGQESDTATGGSDCGADPAPDYQAAAGAWIEFDPADADPATETFDVVICDDSLDEEDEETFTVRLDADSVQNATVGASLAQAQIADNDDEPTVEVVDCPDEDLKLEPCPDGVGASAGEGEDLAFTVRLSAASAKVVTVDARTFSGTPNLAAVPHDDVPEGESADYTAVSRRLTFNPGDPLEQTVAVPTLTDDETEGDERLLLRLSVPVAPDVDANVRLGDSSALGVIRAPCLPVSDDHSPPRLVAATDRSVEEGGDVVAIVRMDPRPCETVGLRIRASPITAVQGEDFYSMEAVHNQPAFDSVWTHYFSLIEDNVDEPDETFRLSWDFFGSGNPANWNSADPVETVVTIVDDDTSKVRVDRASVAEGDGTVTVPSGVLRFPVRLTYANSREVTVIYRPVGPANGATGGRSCSGDADFVIPATRASVNIPKGHRWATATVQLCGDTGPEEDETLLLYLVSAATVTERNNPSVSLTFAERYVAGTILNDDAACVDPGDDNAPAPAITVLDRTAREDEATMSFTVEIDQPVCEGASLPVSYRTADGTAESGSDYTAASGETTLAAGRQSVSVEVALIDDDIGEGDETFSFEAGWGAGAPARYRSASAVSATGTITDNDSEVFLQVSDAGPVDEGEDLVFTVSLVNAGGSPTASGEPVSVRYHTQDLTATGGDSRTDPGADYRRVLAASPDRLDFAAGVTSKTVTVATFTDSRDEGDEHFQLRFVNPSSNALLRNRVGTGTIGSGCVDPGDSTHGRPEVSFTPLRVAEDAGTPSFALVAGCTTTAATWRLEFSGVTATVAPESTDVGTGYTFADGATADVAAADRLETFAAAAPASITGRLAVNDDDRHERDETLRVRAVWVGDLPSHWGSRHWDFTVTVVDDDDPEVVAFNDVRVSEGDGSAVLTVELAAPATEAVSVAYTTLAQSGDGAAAAGADYTHTAQRLTIVAGADRATISVPIVDDDDEEDDETFLVRLSDPLGGLRLGGDTDAQVTIVDNDRCIDPAVDGPPQWKAATGFPNDHRISQWHAAEEGNPIWFGIEIDRPLCQGLRYKTRVIAGGTALVRRDFQVAPSGSSWFEPWHTVDPTGFAVDTFEDAEIEENETVIVEVWWCRTSEYLCRGGGGHHGTIQLSEAWYDARLWLTGTIIDDDDSEVTVANVAAVEAAEDAGEMVFVMNLDPPPKQEATVRYVTAATPSAGRRAATRGLDYTHVGDTLSIDPGEGRALIPVPLVDDELTEPDETFLLRLQAVSGLRMADPTAQGTILDDDTPLPELSAPEPDGVFEGDSVTFTVTLSAESSRVVTVGYRTEPGTASAGSDYTHTEGTLTFQPSETSKTVTVATVNDGAAESTEQFGLRLVNEANARVAAADRVTSVTVYDDENPPPVSLSVAGAYAAEGEPLEFAVTLDNPSLRQVTLPYSTVDGTATAGADYTAASRSLVIDPRSLSATISVPTARDADAGEGDETIILSFGTATNATAPTRAPTGTIRDGPAIGTPELSVSDAKGVREGGRLAFEVKLDPAPQSEVTVQYRTVDGTAVAPDDYTSSRGTLTFAARDASETVDVQTIDDEVIEVDETLRLELVRVVSGDASIVGGSGEGTIIGEKATISVHDAVVDEETDSTRSHSPIGGHIEVRLDRALEVDLPFGLRYNSETLLYGFSRIWTAGHNLFSDFFERCSNWIPAGTTLFRCEIVTVDDGSYEGAETAEVVLILNSRRECRSVSDDPSTCVVPTDHAVVGDGSATLTVTEDESPPRIGVENLTVAEVEHTLTLEASLSGPVSERTVVVDWATEDGAGAGAATGGTSCTRGRDYVSGSGTLTYPPADNYNWRGTRSQRIRIGICSDSAREGNEVFYVRLSRPSHATLHGDTDNDGEVLVKITITDND